MNSKNAFGRRELPKSWVGRQWAKTKNWLYAAGSSAAIALPALAGDSQVRSVVKDATTQAPLDSALVQYVVGADTTRMWTDKNGIASGEVTPIEEETHTIPASYSLKAYPSIVERSGTVHAEISSKEHNKPTIHVYNTLGQDVTNHLNNLSTGTYFLNTTMNGKNYTQRIVASGEFNIETTLKTTEKTTPSKQGLTKTTNTVLTDVMIAKAGYDTIRTTEWLDDTQINEFEYDMNPTPTYIIKGSLWNQTGDYNPANATIFIQPNGGTIRSVPVDENGNFNTTYTMNGSTNIKIWMNADNFTNGTISILNPNKYAVNGIITSAATLASPDTAETTLENLAIPQGIVMEGLANKYFYDNIFREMAGGRLGPGTIRRRTPVEIYIYTKDYSSGEPISQGMTDAINLEADYRIDDQQQTNGIILNHVYKTVHDTIPSNLNNWKFKQFLYQDASYPPGNSVDELDNEGYIIRHTATTSTGNLNTICAEINEEYMDEYNGDLAPVLDGNGRLNELGRTINSFVHTHPLGTPTPQYTGQAAKFMNNLKEKARQEQTRNEQNNIHLQQ